MEKINNYLLFFCCSVILDSGCGHKHNETENYATTFSELTMQLGCRHKAWGAVIDSIKYKKATYETHELYNIIKITEQYLNNHEGLTTSFKEQSKTFIVAPVKKMV